MMPLPGVIEPRWWTGTPALPRESFTIDCSQFSMDDGDLRPDSELSRQMNAMYDEVGLLYLINTGLNDLQTMRAFATLVVKDEMRYQGGANPRDDLQANVYEVGAPLQAWLHYHHEMAYIGQSTKLLGFLCHKAVRDKGFTFVSDNLRATEAILATEFGQKLKELGLCYHRNLTDRDAFAGTEQIGVYNHWQKSMLTDDPDEAESVARSRGLEIEWGPNRLLKTRYYVSAFEYFPMLDRNVLYSSVADDAMWFDAWPKVMHLPYDDRPLKLTFGDDSELSREEKSLFVDIYDRFGIPIEWNVGDIAIICNYRFAHGRPGIHLKDDEERELGVLIGEAYERVGDLADKW
ncbi:MAG: TauD/TfdA family dioxygenase [Gammaproteobacteria bacterium]|nr:TauD/TfdA family dioxygenase [Gammaproteobacteria bacterium]MBU2676058.1 TauD/TfdA family dioxygenase [Gammaproteobacteria bacterium]NNC58326.1 syringomycin synthesis regulator SyrP [Woeseiaceae bacterium]NNL49794.1 syringomycin synthesis regulator SyrP [Woeseiaceae bacterium]